MKKINLIFIFTILSLTGWAQTNTFPTSGNVGIGTTAPTSKLHINSIERTAFRLYRTGRTDKYLSLWHGTGGAVIEPIRTDGKTSFMYLGGYDSPTNVLMGVKGGNVGIGTASPRHKLDVNGTVRAKEVRVEASPWPDYVFGQGYALKSLIEIEQFIAEHQHLPEIPSAAEVEEKGIALGEMNAKLLQKIEEMTLHMIEMKKEINLQYKEIKTLKEENHTLNTLIQRIETLESQVQNSKK